MASVQGAISTADKIGRWAKPNRSPSSRDKVALQTKSTPQATPTASTAQGIMHKRMDALLNTGDRHGRFTVKELGQTGRQGSVVSAQSGPIETAASEAVRGSDASAPPSPVRQIAEAFQSSSARNGQEIVIRLDPPELGRVSVKLRIEGGEVRGVLEVDNPRTLSQLQREAPNLMTRLADAGIEMKRMDLSLTEDGARGSMRDLSWFSQQYGENGSGYGGSDSRDQGRATDDALSGGPDSEGVLSPALATIDDDSINIWI